MLIQTSDIHVNSKSFVIVYQYGTIYNITGVTTTFFSGVSPDIESGITISSGFTFNINDFPYNINRIDIIDNIVDYIYDSVNLDLNKYMLDVLIVDQDHIYTEVSGATNYCVKLSITNTLGCVMYDYFIMNVINTNIIDIDYTYYMPVEKIEFPILQPKKEVINVDPNPIIFYKYGVLYNTTGFTTTQYSGASINIESGITISSGFTFNINDFPYNINRIDIIDNIVDYINLNNSDKYSIDVIIVDDKIVYNEVSGATNYCVKLSLVNNAGCVIEEYFIMNIIKEETEIDHTYYMPIEKIEAKTTMSCIDTGPIFVDSEPPIIVYQYGVITSFESNTNIFSGVSSGITPNLSIDKAFLLNIEGFDRNEITRIDIIDNVVDYVYDMIDLDVNKYMLDVLITDKNLIYSKVTNRGDYLVKFKISDKFGNIVVDYLIMRVVDGTDDVACFPGGIWRDNKVWIDTYIWMDYIL